LLILASVAITIPIVYNLRLQLKPEQLEQARERWQRRGTPNYNLAYTARYDREPEPDEIGSRCAAARLCRLS